MTTPLDQPFVNISDLIARHGRFRRSQTAVMCEGIARNWGDFDANVSRIANRLISSEIGKGDRVAVLMENSIEMLEVMFGVVRAGACVVPLSGLLTAEQLAGLIVDSRAGMVFASKAFLERIDKVRTSLGHIHAERFVSVGFDGTGWNEFGAWLADASNAFAGVRHDPGDEFNVIYSSGTTGIPKGIVQTHSARQHFAFSNAIDLGIGSSSHTLTTTSLYSNGTWIVMLPTLFAGGTLHVMSSFNAADFLRTVEREKITHSFMVPAQFISILDDPALNDTDTSSLRTLLCAGSPLRRDTKRKVLQHLSSGLCELYGFSEGFAAILKAHEHDGKFETVGTPVLGFDLRIIDENGDECSPGTPGEIVGYGAGMLREYNAQPQLTKDLIWRDPLGRTFIRSGDIGMVDEDGYLTILDRKKDMIISGGFNIFPTDVESVVGEHPDVSDVTVIGVPHEKWGETCLALVVPKPGVSANPETIRSWANERLARYQRLAQVELRADFPRNALGKVLKRQLREPYWEENSRHAS